jgi:hypothetical protein
MKKVILSVLCILLTVVLFVPVGLYLQWALPGDGPYKLVFSLYSVPTLIVALVLLWTVPKTRDDTTRRAGAVAATCLLVFFVLAQVFIWVPQISRRTGPWVELRSLLIQKSSEAEDARTQLGIPADRDLTQEEMMRVKAMVFEPPEEFVFPLINKKVTLRMMGKQSPYVGIDYGGGRRVILDLESMEAIYAD